MDYFWGYSHSTEYLGCKITSSPLHLIRDLHSSSAFNLKVVDYSKIVSHLSFNVSFKFEASWVGIELARCEAPACDDGAVMLVRKIRECLPTWGKTSSKKFYSKSQC